MKKKIMLTLLMATACIAAAVAAVPASVSRAVSQVNAAPSLNVECIVNGSPASMAISGDCFIIELPDARVCYDGKTQWSYSAADKEVTIFEPTAAELAEINPLHILRTLASDFKGSHVKGDPNTVRLTPLNKQSGVAEATVTFDPTSGWPVAMTLITGSGRADITAIRFAVGKTKKDPAAFKFKAPAGTTVSDLR